jgi:hypothetical protein
MAGTKDSRKFCCLAKPKDWAMALANPKTCPLFTAKSADRRNKKGAAFGRKREVSAKAWPTATALPPLVAAAASALAAASPLPPVKALARDSAAALGLLPVITLCSVAASPCNKHNTPMQDLSVQYIKVAWPTGMANTIMLVVLMGNQQKLRTQTSECDHDPVQMQEPGCQFP